VLTILVLILIIIVTLIGGGDKSVEQKQNVSEPAQYDQTDETVTPVEPDPVEPDPVEPDPVEPDPVKPDPVEPEPVEPAGPLAYFEEYVKPYLTTKTEAWDSVVPYQYARLYSNKVEKLGSSGEHKQMSLGADSSGNQYLSRDKVSSKASPFYGVSPAARCINLKNGWWINPWAQVAGISRDAKSISVYAYLSRTSSSFNLEVNAGLNLCTEDTYEYRI